MAQFIFLFVAIAETESQYSAGIKLFCMPKIACCKPLMQAFCFKWINYYWLSLLVSQIHFITLHPHSEVDSYIQKLLVLFRRLYTLFYYVTYSNGLYNSKPMFQPVAPIFTYVSYRWMWYFVGLKYVIFAMRLQLLFNIIYGAMLV